MTELLDFNINELMLFIVGILGGVGALCLIIQKSKCEEISCFCFSCKRDVKAVIKQSKLDRGILTNTVDDRTPRRASIP